MITLIGVGHVFDIDAQVRERIAEARPTVVCIELDRARYISLMTGPRGRGGPLLYNALALFQKWIARKYGSDVGREMIAAVDSARELGADVAFIDMDAAVVFQKFWSGMSFEERVKMVVALISSLFVRRKSVEQEIEKFEEDGEAYLEAFGEEFPSIRKVLIDDRDAHMARAIRELSETHENLVAVIGDGHVEGVRRHLADREVQVVRLRDLRSHGSTSNASYSFSVQE